MCKKDKIQGRKLTMKLIISNSVEKLNNHCSEIIAGMIQTNPKLKLGLATGKTPIGIYRSLVSLFKNGKINFNDVTTFNLDENLGISKDDPRSFSSFMKKHLFDHINLKNENINIPNGGAKDPQDECKRYDKILVQAGSIDVQILGVGLNGHIGYNEPNKNLSSYTHIETLAEVTRKASSRIFSTLEETPVQGITMGVSSISQSKMIICMALGKEKAQIMKKVLEGPITTQCPASLLQSHPNCLFFLDEDAASLLDLKKIFFDIQYL